MRAKRAAREALLYIIDLFSFLLFNIFNKLFQFMNNLKAKVEFLSRWFNPANDYIKNNIQWQSFDFYVLANGDNQRYKEIGSHSGQLDFLINSRHFENLLHAGNGFGKTDIIARKHIAKIIVHFFDPVKTGKPYKTLNIAITREQAELVQERIVSLLKNSPVANWLIKDCVTFPHPEIRWVNGAVTEFRTTKRKAEAVEGHEYGYISADEIALEQHLEFIREKILIPRLRKYEDAQLDWFATPKGMNAYYRIKNIIEKSGGFVRSGSSYENPHINKNVLDYMSTNWSKEKVDQILFGQFVDNPNFLFASRIDKLIDNDLELTDVVDRTKKYIEGWDLARGRKGEIADQTVGYRIQKGKQNRIVSRWAFQLPWTEKERELMLLKNEVAHSSTEREIRKYQSQSNAECFVDSTGIGDTLFSMLQDIARPVDFRGKKDKILDHAQAVIDADLIKSPYIPDLVEQMTVYERDDKNLATDDIMAFCIALQSIPVVNNFVGTLDI